MALFSSLRFREQPVADPGLGSYQFWLGRFGFEFFAQVRDVHAQIVSLLNCIGSPDLLQDLPMGKHLPRVTNE